MKILRENTVSRPAECPYLPGRDFVQEFFFAIDLTSADFQVLLESGWRRFGIFFFRPRCPGCRECQPIRIPVRDFSPTKSQRRVLKKNRETRVTLRHIGDFTAAEPEDRQIPLLARAFDIYRTHSEVKFSMEKERFNRFLDSFYNPAVPCYQTEYRREENLFGVGYLDQGTDGLSSVYFSYDPEFRDYSPGTYSALREIRLTEEMGLKYYYLGYFVEGCRSMEYKNRFRPFQLRKWETGKWAVPD